MPTGTQGLLSYRGALGASEGASTTPTRLLYFGAPGNVDDSGIQQFETIEDRVAWGKLDGVRNIYAGLEDNAIVLSNVPASYEDFGFPLVLIPGMDSSSSGEGANTPTTTDTSAYTRTFLPLQTTTEWGASGGYDLHMQWASTDLLSTVGWSLPGLRFAEWNCTFQKRASGADSGVLWGGTLVTPRACTNITAFTGSLSDRAQTLALGKLNVASVDTSAGGLGGTADPNIIRATFSIANPQEWHDGMDGLARHTSMHFPAQWASRLTIVRKFSDLTEYNAWTARTLRAVRIKNEGAVIGATTAKNTIQLDFIGKPIGHRMLWEGNGIRYAEITLEGIYDSTLGASWKFTTISTVSAAYTTA